MFTGMPGPFDGLRRSLAQHGQHGQHRSLAHKKSTLTFYEYPRNALPNDNETQRESRGNDDLTSITTRSPLVGTSIGVLGVLF